MHFNDAEMDRNRKRCESDKIAMVNSTLKKSPSIMYPLPTPNELPVKMDNDQRTNYLTQTRLRSISSNRHSLPIPQQISKDMKTNFDENQEANRDFSLNPKTRIIRIEKGLFTEIERISGLLGCVGQIYQNGFDVVRVDEWVIHFRGEPFLHSPFGVVIDQPIRKWIDKVSLNRGDVFLKRDHVLVREGYKDVNIELNAKYIINLRKKLYPSPPDPKTLRFFIKVLCNEILLSRRFDGVAALLHLFMDRSPVFSISRSIPVNRWSRLSLPFAEKLIQSVKDRDSNLFQEAWEGLLGLGPGLTPSGDDFLEGFMAAHHIMASPFVQNLDILDSNESLRETAEKKTVPISCQFLSCALRGVYSEILYMVFESLRSTEQLRKNGNPLQLRQREKKQIEYFLKWGHSSGADTLTGIVFGLWSMIPPDNHLRPPTEAIPQWTPVRKRPTSDR
jgi:hypothetical protein